MKRPPFYPARWPVSVSSSDFGRPSNQRYAALVVLLVGVLLGSGCSTSPYKNDISTFQTGVNLTADSFQKQHDQTLAKYREFAFEDFASEGVVVSIAPECGDVAVKTLVKDGECLASWANYRSLPSREQQNPPTCKGSTEGLALGTPAIYSFESIRKREAALCKIGLMEKDRTLDTSKLEAATTLLVESPKLPPALQGYAAALVGIADAADRTALAESVGKAKLQIQALGNRIDELDGGKSPYTQVLGPISGLVGSTLTAVLERRRLKALRSVTAAADPLVTQAAIVLSNVSVPMTTLALQDAGMTVDNAIPGPEEKFTAEQWAQTYIAAAEARDRYLSIYTNNPANAYRAMAKAHSVLTRALADTSKQYEAVMAATMDFVEKAKAVQDELTKANKAEGSAEAEDAVDSEE